MVDNYEAAWRSLRRRRLLFWGSWLGALPFIMGANALSLLVRNTGLSNTEVLPFFALVAGGFMGGGIAVGVFRCPRCANLFFMRGLWRNPFARRCLHCQLRTGTVGPDQSAPGIATIPPTVALAGDRYVETFHHINERLRLGNYVHRPMVRRAMAAGALLICIACVPLFIALLHLVFGDVLGGGGLPRPRGAGPPPGFMQLWFAALAYGVVGLALACAYGIHIVTNPHLSDAQRARWTRAIAFGGPFAMLAYAFVHFRDESAGSKAP